MKTLGDCELRNCMSCDGHDECPPVVWKAMEDAPRDGRQILAISKYYGAIAVKWFRYNGAYQFRTIDAEPVEDLIFWCDINPIPDVVVRLCKQGGKVTDDEMEAIMKFLGPSKVPNDAQKVN